MVLAGSQTGQVGQLKAVVHGFLTQRRELRARDKLNDDSCESRIHAACASGLESSLLDHSCKLSFSDT